MVDFRALDDQLMVVRAINRMAIIQYGSSNNNIYIFLFKLF